MALLLNKLFLNKEYDNVYVNIDVVDIYGGDKANVFLHYWRDSSKAEKIYGDMVTIDFDRTSDVNLYTQVYERLKEIDAFATAIDV